MERPRTRCLFDATDGLPLDARIIGGAVDDDVQSAVTVAYGALIVSGRFVGMADILGSTYTSTGPTLDAFVARVLDVP